MRPALLLALLCGLPLGCYRSHDLAPEEEVVEGPPAGPWYFPGCGALERGVALIACDDGHALLWPSTSGAMGEDGVIVPDTAEPLVGTVVERSAYTMVLSFEGGSSAFSRIELRWGAIDPSLIDWRDQAWDPGACTAGHLLFDDELLLAPDWAWLEC